MGGQAKTHDFATLNTPVRETHGMHYCACQEACRVEMGSNRQAGSTLTGVNAGGQQTLTAGIQQGVARWCGRGLDYYKRRGRAKLCRILCAEFEPQRTRGTPIA